ncbi:MAG: hypothetical protein A2X23_00670 [Chloroflexi bacterium GWC2_73_18]|nr:MAG: hypothetical protein A2X23_00670 [Chloroflexi bacterium GWC2_73_18]
MIETVRSPAAAAPDPSPSGAAVPAVSPGLREPGAATRAAASLRDVILGGQDGLVNVLGLVLGMAAATSDTRVVLTAGLAAMLAESIAMAGVAYTASGAEREGAARIGARLRAGMAGRAALRIATRAEALRQAGHAPETVETVVAAGGDEAEAWREEIERLGRELAPIRETRPLRAAVTVGLATICGSAVPLLPFVLTPMAVAPWLSLAAGGTVLFGAGVYRARLAGTAGLRAGLEMIAIGLLSALAGYLIGLLLRAPAA